MKGRKCVPFIICYAICTYSFLEPRHHTRCDGAVIVQSCQWALCYPNCCLPSSSTIRYAEFKEFGVIGFFAVRCVQSNVISVCTIGSCSSKACRLYQWYNNLTEKSTEGGLLNAVTHFTFFVNSKRISFVDWWFLIALRTHSTRYLTEASCTAVTARASR